MLEIIQLSNPKITLHPKYISGDKGVIDSINAIDSTEGLVRANPAVPVLTKILNPTIDKLFSEFYDLNAEILSVTADKSFKIAEGKEMSKGEYLVYAVGCSTFSHDINGMKSFLNGTGELDGETCVGLRDYAIPLSKDQMNGLLGDGVTHIVDVGGNVHEKKADIWTFDQFFEAQESKDFLLTTPYHVVLFPKGEAKAMNHGYEGIGYDLVRTHKPSRVLVGSDLIWNKLLDILQDKRDYSSFYVGVPNLVSDSGCVVCLEDNFAGFRGDCMNLDGRSLGVAPEALEKLLSAFYKASDEIVLDRSAVKQASKIFYQNLEKVPVGQLQDKKVMNRVLEKSIQMYLQTQNRK